MRDLVASLTRPVKELKAFQRVTLAAGETRTLAFDLEAASLGFHGRDDRYVVEPGAFRAVGRRRLGSGLESGFEVVE